MSQPPGLSALGCQGSACDRLRLTGGLRALALGSYIVSLRWRGTALSAPFLMPPLAAKTIQPPCGRGNASPLWWLAPPPCPVGSMSLDSQSSTAPYESSSFATPASGGTITRAYCSATYERIALRSFIVPPLRGGRWCRKAPKGGKPPEVANHRNVIHNVRSQRKA